MNDAELIAAARPILGEHHVCDDWEMVLMRAIAAAERERIAVLVDAMGPRMGGYREVAAAIRASRTEGST